MQLHLVKKEEKFHIQFMISQIHNSYSSKLFGKNIQNIEKDEFIFI